MQTDVSPQVSAEFMLCATFGDAARTAEGALSDGLSYDVVRRQVNRRDQSRVRLGRQRRQLGC